jgi:outer membrane protein assembly factor BamD (BamD/ComL family)
MGAESRSALLAESALLGDARAKLAAENSRGALDDVARLENRFPHGRLVQEREVVAIDAHAGLGNRAALRARAQAFLERFPQSPYASHVRQSLEQ